MNNHQHPLSIWLNDIFRLHQGETIQRFMPLRITPKFWVENYEQLPPIDQATEALVPPLPYKSILLGTMVDVKVPGRSELSGPATLVTYAHSIENAYLLDCILTPADGPIYLGMIETKPINLGTDTIGDLEIKITPITDGLEPTFKAVTELFSCFMALLSSENVSISDPPTCFSRKRELSRIKQGKRVENYHIHHLRIARNRKAPTIAADTEKSRKRGHWRRAHLRHYRAGVGHIKTTKTVAIAPMFVGDSAVSVDKDYIV